MSFYRTYRPQTIAELDNASTKKLLLSLLSKKRVDLPHSYLLTGPKGIGKTTTARLIAKLFTCEKLSPTNGPCGVCDSCVTIAAGRNMNVTEMDAASNRGIDEVRSLRESIATTPIGADYKVYIIDEVHMMTNEAFNALLKTLEEPPAHAIFVLATTDLHKVPETIRSRCLVVHFSRASTAELTDALQTIVSKEKLVVAAEALEKIVQKADGSFRDAVKYLEQVSLSGSEISVRSVEQSLSSSSDAQVGEFLAYIQAKDAANALMWVEKVSQSGVSMKTFLSDVLTMLQNIMVGKVKGTFESAWGLDQLGCAVREFGDAYAEMKNSPVPTLPVSLAVVTLCDNGMSTPKIEVVSAPVKVSSRVASASHTTSKPVEIKRPPEAETQPIALNSADEPTGDGTGLLTLKKLVDNWSDFLMAIKPHNNSLSGFLRSSRPKSVSGGIVTFEAFYALHKEKISEPKSVEIMVRVIKELFGDQVRIDVVLGKK